MASVMGSFLKANHELPQLQQLGNREAPRRAREEGLHPAFSTRPRATARSPRAGGARIGVASLCLALTACQSSTEQTSPSTRDVFETYVFTAVPWVTDPRGNAFLLDTGSPRTQLVPGILGLDDDHFSERIVDSVELRGLSIADISVVVSSTLPAPLQNGLENSGRLNFGGVIGSDLLGLRDFAFDARDQRLLFGDPLASLTNVGPATDVGARLKGGGSTCLAPEQCYAFGATRWLVDVELDGVTTVALVDTAATYVIVSDSIFTRAQRMGGTRSTVRLERLPTGDTATRIGVFDEVRVGEVALDDVGMIVRGGGFDSALARLQVETGERVEVLLGHSVLQRFVTEFSVDPPTLKLREYEPPRDDPFPVPQTGLGFGLVSDASCFSVTSLIQDTPVAARGLQLGDCVTHIDGHQTFSPEAKDRVRTTSLGDEVVLTIEREGEPFELVAEHVTLLHGPPSG